MDGVTPSGRFNCGNVNVASGGPLRPDTARRSGGAEDAGRTGSGTCVTPHTIEAGIRRPIDARPDDTRAFDAKVGRAG